MRHASGQFETFQPLGIVTPARSEDLQLPGWFLLGGVGILESYLRTGSFSLRGEETGARTKRSLVCHVTSQRPCRGDPPLPPGLTPANAPSHPAHHLQGGPRRAPTGRALRWGPSRAPPAVARAPPPPRAALGPRGASPLLSGGVKKSAGKNTEDTNSLGTSSRTSSNRGSQAPVKFNVSKTSRARTVGTVASVTRLAAPPAGPAPPRPEALSPHVLQP